MCANTDLDVAMDACCTYSSPNPIATHLCNFDVERTTYATAQSRCTAKRGGDTCDWFSIDNSNGCTTFALDESWHWTNQDCRLRVEGA